MVAPTHATGKNVPLSARARLRQGQTSAGAYRMRPYGLRFRQREKTPRGAPPSLGPLCEGAPPAGGGGENRAAGRNISGPDWRKLL